MKESKKLNNIYKIRLENSTNHLEVGINNYKTKSDNNCNQIHHERPSSKRCSNANNSNINEIVCNKSCCCCCCCCRSKYSPHKEAKKNSNVVLSIVNKKAKCSKCSSDINESNNPIVDSEINSNDFYYKPKLYNASSFASKLLSASSERSNKISSKLDYSQYIQSPLIQNIKLYRNKSSKFNNIDCCNNTRNSHSGGSKPMQAFLVPSSASNTSAKVSKLVNENKNYGTNLFVNVYNINDKKIQHVVETKRPPKYPHDENSSTKINKEHDIYFKHQQQQIQKRKQQQYEMQQQQLEEEYEYHPQQEQYQYEEQQQYAQPKQRKSKSSGMSHRNHSSEELLMNNNVPPKVKSRGKHRQSSALSQQEAQEIIMTDPNGSYYGQNEQETYVEHYVDPRNSINYYANNSNMNTSNNTYYRIAESNQENEISVSSSSKKTLTNPDVSQLNSSNNSTNVNYNTNNNSNSSGNNNKIFFLGNTSSLKNSNEGASERSNLTTITQNSSTNNGNYQLNSSNMNTANYTSVNETNNFVVGSSNIDLTKTMSSYDFSNYIDKLINRFRTRAKLYHEQNNIANNSRMSQNSSIKQTAEYQRDTTYAKYVSNENILNTSQKDHQKTNGSSNLFKLKGQEINRPLIPKIEYRRVIDSKESTISSSKNSTATVQTISVKSVDNNSNKTADLRETTNTLTYNTNNNSQYQQQLQQQQQQQKRNNLNEGSSFINFTHSYEIDEDVLLDENSQLEATLDLSQ